MDVGSEELALLHQRSEGWGAVLQMAALSLSSNRDPERLARALAVRSQTIAEYFVSEVLEQPPEVVQFMLDTSWPVTARGIAEAALPSVTVSADLAGGWRRRLAEVTS